MPENPMELFRREAPEVAKAFDGLILSLVASEGLDQKTKQLIYIENPQRRVFSNSVERCVQHHTSR